MVPRGRNRLVCRVTFVTEVRRRRANGEVSREKVLDAAAEIAGERGYDGTSINLISERSGLPPSSIYWHFKDKDELIAQVIERSYGRWQAASSPRLVDGTSTDASFAESMLQVGAAISDFPDFLRLGLLLVLERRPEEPTARRKFIEIRRATAQATAGGYREQFPDLDDDDIQQLTTMTIALADGLFVAQEAGESEMRRSFDLLAAAVLGTAERMMASKQAAPSPRATERRSPAKRAARTGRVTTR
jgi:AcrR family transcriptional regulator